MIKQNCFVIVCQNINIDLSKWKDCQFIAVEQGAIKLINENYPIVLACADFDHTSKEQLEIIKKHVKNIEILPQDKDILDSEYAIKKAIAMQATSIKLIVSGHRWGMIYGLINLLIKYHDYNLEIYNETNILKFINTPTFFLKTEYLEYRYFDFLPLMDTKLNLKGFKYPLNENYELKPYDNYFISNELEALRGEINIKQGCGILTISKEYEKND